MGMLNDLRPHRRTFQSSAVVRLGCVGLLQDRAILGRCEQAVVDTGTVRRLIECQQVGRCCAGRGQPLSLFNLLFRCDGGFVRGVQLARSASICAPCAASFLGPGATRA